MRFIHVFGSSADFIVFRYGKKDKYDLRPSLQPEMTIDKVKDRIGHNSWLGFLVQPILFRLYLVGEDMVLGKPLDLLRTLGSYIDGNNSILVVKFLDDDDIIQRRKEVFDKKDDLFSRPKFL